MPKIILITSIYPYGRGEEFLEREVLAWSNSSEPIQLVVMPLRSAKTQRPLPQGVALDGSLISDSRLAKIYFAVIASLRADFWMEVFYIYKKGKLSIAAIKNLFVSAGALCRVRQGLRRYIKLNGTPDLAYSYWNEAAGYAACSLKREGLIDLVVSRAHGGDLYEERKPSGYAPFKRKYINDFDEIYVLAPNARSYIAEKYGASPDRLYVMPLGVYIPPLVPSKKQNEAVSIVSISYCVPLKKIDKIIEAICCLASGAPDIRYSWTHIGGGRLEDQLHVLATQKFSAFPNVSFNFTGSLENSEVKNFLASNYFDVIVNASEAEGVPVSLMEAMSYAVPAVAPNVGEINFLVNHENGVLLSAAPTPDELADGIREILSETSSKNRRNCARATIVSAFNEEINYKNFVSHLASLLKKYDDAQ